MGLFRRLIVQDTDSRIIQRKSRRINTEHILVDGKRLPLQIQVRNLQRQQFAHPEAREQVRKDSDTLGLLHNFLYENLHFVRSEYPHFLLYDFRAGGTEGWIAGELIFRFSVDEEVLQNHVVVSDGLGGQTALLPILTPTLELLLLVAVLDHVLGDLMQRHSPKGRGKMRVAGSNVAGVSRGLPGRRRLVELQPLHKRRFKQCLGLQRMTQPGHDVLLLRRFLPFGLRLFF